MMKMLRIGSIARPWKKDAEYRQYMLSQVAQSSSRSKLNTGRRVLDLVTLLKEADPRPPQGRSVLCVGCRNAHELDIVQAAGFDPVVGIDLLGDAGRVLPMDMHALRFPKQVFDVVFTCHSLEHAYDVDVVLQEFARVTKPGGVWAIAVPIRFQTTAVDRHDFKSAEALGAACQRAGAEPALTLRAGVGDVSVACAIVRMP